MGNAWTHSPVAALGSPRQSAHSAAYENASCPSPGAAKSKKEGMFILATAIYPGRSLSSSYQGLKDHKEFIVVEARQELCVFHHAL